MIVVAVDPGYRESARVAFDGARVLSHVIEDNERFLEWTLEARSSDAVLVIEEMQLFAGHMAGKEIFDSVFWSGRFAQAWRPHRFEQLLRSRVRAHLGCTKGGDPAVRQALIQRFGPYKEDAIGKPKKPGPLFGLRAHEWSALAIAVTWWDTVGSKLPETPALRPGVHAEFEEPSESSPRQDRWNF